MPIFHNRKLYIGDVNIDKDGATKEKSKHHVHNISYFTLFKFSSKCDKFLILVAISASIITGITMPFAIALVADAFQNMIDYAKDIAAGKNDAEAFLTKMHLFGIYYTIIGIVLFAGGYLASALMNVTAINQIFKIREQYLRAVLNQDFSYFDLSQSRDFASKMADDVIKLEAGIGNKLTSFINNLTTAFACVMMATVKGWKLALLCLATAPVTVLLVGFAGMIANKQYKKEAVQTSRASAIAEEVLSSIRTVYAFNGQQKEIDRYSGPLAEARKIKIKKELFTGMSMGFLFFCLFSSYALSFYFGIYLIINDPERYNADVMFSVFFGVMTGLSNFGMAAPLMTAFGSARGAGAHIFHIINNVPTINPFLDRGLKPATVDGVIEFKNVNFHYPSRPDVPVLKGVNLVVRRGQSVALVGHSGGGKSTVIQLISRFYDVDEGSVSLDGHDVRKLSVRWLRSQIGLVRQEPVLFNTTIRENIRFGREDATYADIEQAAKEAYAHSFIVNLPKGYDTLVGERGASLSGGQKQRIAIARALVRNPRVLLLDEATSALDTDSEAQVQHALQKASQGRTTLTVAHRLSTVHNMDVIYVFKNGEVIEIGKHEELVNKKGHYYELLTLEMLGQKATSDNEFLFDDANLREESNITEDDIKIMVEQDVSDEYMESKTPKLSFWKVVALNAPEWKSITTGSVSSIIIGFSMPLFVILFGMWFQSLSSNDTVVLMQEAKNVAVTCLTIGLVMGICIFIQSLSFGIAGAYLTERLRHLMFSHMLRQPIAYYDKRANSTGVLCAKLASEAAFVHEATGQNIGMILQALGSIGLAVILAVVYEWRVGLSIFSFLPFVMLVYYYQGKMTTEESFGNAKTVELSTKVAIEAVVNIRTVAALSREPNILHDYVSELQDAMPVSKRAAHCRGFVAGLSRAMFNFVNSVALNYGAHLMVSDAVPYHNIIVITQSLQMAATQAQDVFIYAPDIQKGALAASRIVALLNVEPTIRDPLKPAVIGFKSSGGASFTNVEFNYPTRPLVQVLRGLSLQIEKGKTIALVGKSGCGKSTVMQLLQRFYDPDIGFVALDGVPLQQLRIDEARSSFGLVSQEPVLFDRSIAENIAYGDNSRTPADHEIVEAAKQANIHQFVISLPQGFATNIGANGTQLSGGQKQRVAIARALIRKPKILLLDEATSALDTESEKVVQEALDAAKAGRTCVMIAHRLSTVRDADRVCVLSDGRVAEDGTHTQLLELKGLYHHLYNAT